MDTQSLYGLLVTHQYALFAALVVGGLVRLTKNDTTLPVDVPPQWRKALALALSLAAAALEKYALHADWKKALFDGALAWFAAEWGHHLVVDQLRGGRELPIPGLMVPGSRPGPRKPVTLPPDAPPSGPSIMPPPLGVFVVVCAGALTCLHLTGCTKVLKVADLVLDKAACVIANQDLPNEEIFMKCAVQAGDVPRYLEILSQSRAATRKALEAQKGSCK
jgi:hypothetical protein